MPHGLFTENEVGMQEWKRLAMRKAMEIAEQEGWKMVDIDSNCKEIIDKIAGKDWNDKWVGTILEDISNLSCTFEKVSSLS